MKWDAPEHWPEPGSIMWEVATAILYCPACDRLSAAEVRQLVEAASRCAERIASRQVDDYISHQAKANLEKDAYLASRTVEGC